MKVPAWLKVNDIELTNASNVGIENFSDEGNNTYKLTFAMRNANQVIGIKVKYETQNTGGYLSNQDTVVKFWVDWQMPSYNLTSAKRPLFEKILVLYQPAMLLVEDDGFMMQEFKLERESRGYAANTMENIPDDPLRKADIDSIENYYYVTPDTGYFVMKGYVPGGETNTFRYFYANVKSPDINFSTLFQKTDLDAIIERNHVVIGSIPANDIILNTTGIAIEYSFVGDALHANDTILIRIPFKIRTPQNTSKLLTGEAFVCDTSIFTHFSPNNVFDYDFTYRQGKDRMSQNFYAYGESFHYGSDQSSLTFTSPHVPATNQLIANVYNNGSQSIPYNIFKNEARQFYKFTKFEAKVPVGYILENDEKLTIIPNTNMRSFSLNYANTMQIAPSSKSESGGVTTYTYDLSSLYDSDFTINSIPSTKFPHPAEYIAYTFNFHLQPTAASQPTSKLYYTITHDSYYSTNVVERSSQMTLNYTGDNSTIVLTPHTLNIYSPQVTVSSVKVGNDTENSNDYWIYVGGKAKNASVKDGGGVTIMGEGYHGKWINIGVITGTKVVDFSDLTFDYDMTGCTADTIRVYTVAAFQNVPGFTTAFDKTKPVDSLKPQYIGGYDDLIIQPAPATIAGSLSVSDPVLVYDQPYIVTTSVNTSSSQGFAKDIELELTIPAGQVYDTNSVVIEYPVGNFIPHLEEYLDTLLWKSNQDPNILRTVTLNLNKIMDTTNFTLPGTLSGEPADKQKISIHANFKPNCETSLIGFRYNAKITAGNSCGAAAAGSGNIVYSTQMRSDISTDFRFDIASSLLSGNQAFNELLTKDTLVITLTKRDLVVVPFHPAISNADSLLITLPDLINIEGTEAAISSADIAITLPVLPVGSNTLVGNRYHIYLPLPEDDYNAAVNRGDNQSVTYRIPIAYVNPALPNQPETFIDVEALTTGQFDVACPNQTAISVGSSSLPIATLTSPENPRTVCYNGLDSLTISSLNFSGGFYADKALATQVQAAGNISMLYTPSAVGDTTFYAEAKIGANNYGYVPITFSVRQPPIATVTTHTYIVVDTSAPLFVPVTVYSDAATTITYVYSNDINTQRDTLTFNVPLGVTPNVYSWDLPYGKERGHHYYRLLKIEDGHGCYNSLNVLDSVIVNVVNCHPDSSFTIGSTSIIVNNLPYGQCDTLPIVLPATLTYHWLTQY
ncbi:hypothetical protein LJB75_00915, partial [Bacteroidales bacterium OttesenSCG-928-L19]|nr:hypothetical protein [Bacteroidales bacterium OttesenSCG-928-L19]